MPPTPGRAKPGDCVPAPPPRLRSTHPTNPDARVESYPAIRYRVSLPPRKDIRWISRAVLCVLFVAAGVLHFAMPEPYVRIVPPWLPAPRALVYVSGFFEMAGGIGVLPARTRRLAAVGLVALLVAVWPANVQMLLNAHAAGASPSWQAALAARLPVQLALMAWVWWAAGRPCRAADPPPA
ncbi:MAG: hypothetical protein JWM27_1584 [Gemmatimonadetes bacterium]|nr:hypothetical protein [Gemmatimonadota bacterium]